MTSDQLDTLNTTTDHCSRSKSLHTRSQLLKKKPPPLKVTPLLLKPRRHPLPRRHPPLRRNLPPRNQASLPDYSPGSGERKHPRQKLKKLQLLKRKLLPPLRKLLLLRNP